MFRDSCASSVAAPVLPITMPAYGPSVHHGAGEGKFIMLAIFLIILFAVFRGGHGGLLGDNCATGRNIGPADFWAANGLAQAVPGFQAQNFTQQAINFGETVNAINQGNHSLSMQMSNGFKDTLLLQTQDALSVERQKSLMLESKLYTSEKFNCLEKQNFQNQAAVMAEFCNIKNNMLTKPPVQAAAGLPHLSCTNIPHFGHGFGGGHGGGCLGDCI